MTQLRNGALEQLNPSDHRKGSAWLIGSRIGLTDPLRADGEHMLGHDTVCPLGAVSLLNTRTYERCRAPTLEASQ
jgi:hypothetical protein